METERDFKDHADFSAAMNYMELLLQKCVGNSDSSLNHWQRTLQLLNDIGSHYVSTIDTRVRQVRMAFGTILKLGFIDGMIQKPTLTLEHYQRWVRCDYTVTCWILNPMKQEFYEAFT